jgi:GAF domain
VQIADVKAEQAYVNDPQRFAILELAGARTMFVVPMLKENELVGMIGIYRQEVRPFTDKQIGLVENFADQAVIAIENARLLNELRQRTNDLTDRTADLTEALKQQTATSEVLQVISSSPGDLEPVFATMLEKAVRICDAKFGGVYRCDGDTFTLVATHNLPPPPTPKCAGMHRFVPVQNTFLVASWRPRRWFIAPTLRQSRGTLSNARNT